MNSSSKAGSSSSKVSPEVAAEIARLMRDPNALRHERDGIQQPGGRGHYDPNQPRVPAGNPKGGQFASKGYRGGDSDRDARVMLASLDGVQLAQLGQGNPRDAYSGRDVRATQASFSGTQFAELGQGNPRDTGTQAQPFGGLFGEILTSEGYKSQVGFLRAEHDLQTNRKTQARGFQAGHFEFISTGPMGAAELPDGGYRFVLSSTTYAYDPLTGAYATISATPTRPIEILEIDRKLFIREFRR